MVLGLNHYESEQTVRDFGQQFGVTFPLLLDGAEYGQYGQPGGQSPFPLDYLIDMEGNVAYFNTEYEPVTMQSIIDSLINPQTDANDNFDIPHPVELEVIGNYPNPFNSGTRISFYLPDKDHVIVTIYDLLGRKVAVIFEGNLRPGKATISWDLSDIRYENLNSGVYFYKISSTGKSVAGKLLYLK